MTRLAAAALVVMLVGASTLPSMSAAQPPECRTLQLALTYLNTTATVDSGPAQGMIVNRILRASGTPDDRGHNDDSLTTGSYIALLVKLYQATGDERYLREAEARAQVFNPERPNGPVYWYDDDPRLYVDPRNPEARPVPGTVYWGYNGSHWLMPTPEQAAGAVYGLYHVWNATGNETYAEWIRIIADANLGSASLFVALVLAESAYEATGDVKYKMVVEERLRQVRDQTVPPDFNRNICISSHGANYISMALDYPALKRDVAEYVRVHAWPLVEKILYNKTTGAVYAKRALLANGRLVFYSPSLPCFTPEEAPGAPQDPSWVISSFNALLWARVALIAGRLTGNQTMVEEALSIYNRMLREVIERPRPGDSRAIVGSIPPFVFDQIPPATNVYWISYTRQVSSQATVSLLLLSEAIYRGSGKIGACLATRETQAPEEPLQTPFAGGGAGGADYTLAAASVAASIALYMMYLWRRGLR